jgi:hypothetical protein
VTLARIDHELDLRAGFGDSSEEFLGLTKRCAAIVGPCRISVGVVYTGAPG